MKTTKFLNWAAAGVVAAAGLAGCGDAAFRVTPRRINVLFEGGAYPIAVTSSMAWTAVVDTTWCTVSPISGTGNDTVTVTIAPNPGLGLLQRTATVTFTSGTLIRQVAITQFEDRKLSQLRFTIASDRIGAPAFDGEMGIITHPYDGSSYRVRSMGGTWWMIQNADDGATYTACTYRSIDRDAYGYLYSWSCARSACPSGWSLPTDADCTALFSWLTSNNGWSEWNSGYSLAGYGNRGNYVGGQGSLGNWWSSSSIGRNWLVGSGGTSGNFDTLGSYALFSVRCVKYQ
jgi:uncharacterized protein (TIGR02145 family)